MRIDQTPSSKVALSYFHKDTSLGLIQTPEEPVFLFHSYPSLSLWHLANDLQRLGSGQRSKGVWPFLFFIFKSAPLAARKSAMDALLFLSVPCVPKPMRSCKERKQKAINNY